MKYIKLLFLSIAVTGHVYYGIIQKYDISGIFLIYSGIWFYVVEKAFSQETIPNESTADEDGDRIPDYAMLYQDAINFFDRKSADLNALYEENGDPHVLGMRDAYDQAAQHLEDMVGK